MIDAPMIETSSENERRIFIKEKYPCIADCDTLIVTGTPISVTEYKITLKQKPKNAILR